MNLNNTWSLNDPCQSEVSFVGLISIESIVVGAPDSRAKSLGSTPDQVIVTVHPLHPFLKRVTKRIFFLLFQLVIITFVPVILTCDSGVMSKAGKY